MKTNHPYASHHPDNQKIAFEYLVNTLEHRGTTAKLRIDNRIYLQLASRRRLNPLSPAIPLAAGCACDSHGGNNEGPSLASVMRSRESVRDYEEKPLSFAALSEILWNAAGIRATDLNGLTFRHYPSAGGLYPIQLFVGAKRVEGVEPGIHYYCPHTNSLQLIAGREAMEEAESALLGAQPWIAQAGCFLMFVAETDKTLWKYGSRGLRYILLDCGHVAQNISLMATAVGLGSCGIGGFYELELQEHLAISQPDEIVIYAMTLGIPKTGNKQDSSPTERYA
jgi:SagB-type dehydrogenase family enzyme